ncbi:type II toxin-antitoxin system RelE/ParE family toxin [Agriterribacter sp.]|nr:type II toxin-antitoxin system RelE/ParE family toxin [Agriterribacter sp.]
MRICSKVKSHLIFYRLIEKQNEIEIIRILHQRMDIENRLND